MSDPAANVGEPSEGSVTWFFSRLRSGDESALMALWQRFFPRLLALAERVLANRPQRTANAEDVVQEAVVSFWRQARTGDLPDVLNRDHLWHLLAQFTVFKARRQIRRETAARRGGGAVLDEAALDAGATRLADFAGEVFATDLDLDAAELIDLLDSSVREFVVLRLIGHSTAEIASLMNCTQRKVQRKLELARMHWERHLKRE